MDERAEAAHAHRKMTKWFVEIGDWNAGVLKVAYTARPWPLKLREGAGAADRGRRPIGSRRARAP